MSGEGRVRPIAIGVVRDGERLLVAEGRDDSRDGQVFYRPLGGTIEFGEPAADTVRREFGEEIQADVVVGHLLGVLENVFVYEGEPGHEIVFVFEARLADERLRGVESIACVESDGAGFVARWMPLDTFRAGAAPLYPDGLLELVDREQAT
jgi:ADP-ribose pyrophosphatase YjhB (NUDIX family)